MNVFQFILAIIFPPLAVMDRGCGSFLIVTVLTILGWIPGVLAALIITSSPKYKYQPPKQPDFLDKAKAFEAKVKAWSDRKVAEREAKNK